MHKLLNFKKILLKLQVASVYKKNCHSQTGMHMTHGSLNMQCNPTKNAFLFNKLPITAPVKSFTIITFVTWVLLQNQ